MKEIKVGKIYQHFKGDLYLVEGLALNANTGKTDVVYRGLYENNELYTRVSSEWFEPISDREDNVTGQKDRFEEVVLEKFGKKDS